MLNLGRGLDGYRAAPDKKAAFETLARQLVQQKKDKDLAELLAEHAKAHADDPWRLYFQGELHLLRGEGPQAEAAFAAALAKAGRANEWSFRNGLWRARIQAGKIVATFQELGAGKRPFEDLASVCLQTRNGGALEALVSAYRQAEPEDAEVTAWDLEVRYLKQDYEGALQLLEVHRKDVFALPRHKWKSDNYLVRCLAKLKRSDEAIKEAEAIAKRPMGNGVLLVLAYASGGNVEQTIAVVSKLGSRPFLVEDCYRDEDLGPILRGEAFRAFRERFPEPQRQPDIGW